MVPLLVWTTNSVGPNISGLNIITIYAMYQRTEGTLAIMLFNFVDFVVERAYGISINMEKTIKPSTNRQYFSSQYGLDVSCT